MTTTVALRLRPSLRPSREGMSHEARLLMDIVEGHESNAHSQRLDWRGFLRNRVHEVVHNCRIPDWDGYDAVPISKAAEEGALAFIDLLPEGIQAPDIGPEPDGKIAFEWDAGKDRLFSISVEGSGLVYAGILGAGSYSTGTEVFGTEIPYAIEQALSLYFAAPGLGSADGGP